MYGSWVRALVRTEHQGCSASPVEFDEALIILQCTKWFEALFIKHVDYFLVLTIVVRESK